MRPYEEGADLDSIVLGTTRSPGVVTLSGHDRNKDWDIKAAVGSTGATSSLKGDPIGQFQASFYLADDGYAAEGDDDFTRWDAFQKLIESTTNGPKPIALPIYHPDLARNHFTEVVSGGIGGRLHDGKGGCTVVVKFLEFRPPKPKAPAKAAGKNAAPGAPGAPGAKPDPNFAAKIARDALLAEAKKPL